MTNDVCGCSVSEKEAEESKYAPEDKKQKENETPRVSFSRVDVDDELMMVNVETLRQSCPQHYFFEEHLVILNISKLSECLQ